MSGSDIGPPVNLADVRSAVYLEPAAAQGLALLAIAEDVRKIAGCVAAAGPLQMGVARAVHLEVDRAKVASAVAAAGDHVHIGLPAGLAGDTRVRRAVMRALDVCLECGSADLVPLTHSSSPDVVEAVHCRGCAFVYGTADSARVRAAVGAAVGAAARVVR